MDRQVCKYYLVISAVETEVFPLISKAELSGEFSEELLAAPITSLNDIIFHADDYDLIDAVPFDDNIKLIIRHFIDDYVSDWQVFQFSKNNCNFNEDTKKVTVGSDYAGVYKDLIDNWETKHNIFDVDGRVNAGGNVATYLEALAANSNSPPPAGIGWGSYIYVEGSATPNITVIWLREVSLVFVAGFTQVDDIYVRNWAAGYPGLDLLVQATFSTSGSPTPPDMISTWVSLIEWYSLEFPDRLYSLWAKKNDVLPNLVPTNFTNGINLKSLINFLGKKIDPLFDVRSTFFWNDLREDGTSYPTYNYVASEVEGGNVVNELDKLTLWQATDIKNSDASEKATKGELSLKKLLQDLSFIFGGIKCFYDNNLAFRIEHISDFEQAEDYDLTDNFRILNKNEYGFDKTEFPRDYEFSFIKSLIDNVIGVNLINDTNSDNAKTTPVDCELIVTDQYGLTTNPSEFPDDSFFLAVLDSSFDIIRVASRLSGDIADNYSLSWPNLQHYYHRHNRDVDNVIINNVSVPSLSVNKLKKQVDLNILYDQFYDFKSLFKTGLGWGDVEGIVIGLNNSNLTLKLRHENT